ncbi:MAG TPA: ferritin-like domain-containing protein [Thermoleophilaceae bacterium]|nr:ferritin-like domain-containing protein [Thermoleophilaceae bacterium]
MEETRVKVPESEQDRAAMPRKGDVLSRITHDDSSRKTFLRMVGGAGAVGAFGTLLAACGEEEEEPTGGGGEPEEPGGGASQQVLDVFNYALTLEFLEAKFYQDVIDSGVIEDETLASIAQTFGEHEQEHVDTLKAAIEQMGGTPVEDPMGNFQSVIDGGPMTVLVTAATVENVGAGAYLAEAPKLIESDEALAAALSIHTVEARHAAALNEAAGFGFTGNKMYTGSIPDGPFAEPIDRDAVMKAVQPFLAGGGSGGGSQ